MITVRLKSRAKRTVEYKEGFNCEKVSFHPVGVLVEFKSDEPMFHPWGSVEYASGGEPSDLCLPTAETAMQHDVKPPRRGK